jgi:hypothetical protein
MKKGVRNKIIMLVETPAEAENAPLILNAVSIPESARPLCDTWGNFINPLKAIEQNHGNNFIRVFIYGFEGRFYFGYQLKLKKLIREKRAKVFDISYDTEENARKEARDELTSLATEAKLGKVFITFDKICYNQKELF